MPKKSASKRASKPKPTSQLVKRVARLDEDLVKLLNERANLIRQLGEEQGPATAVDRCLGTEAIASNAGPLADESLQAVFREVNSGCRALVKATRVAYLGPKFSYSYLATVERFGESVDLVPVATIAAVFEELAGGQADYGVVPLENSTDGRVVDTLGMFARMPIRICGEVQLRINHNLLAKCKREDIREVRSKPQALSQCRDWLARHLPWARTVEMTSTAAAAKLAATKEGIAAVAGRLAASTYGLDIVAANIQDNQNNVTRFAVIGGDVAAPTGQDKTALMFEIPHQPGSLADAMAIFKRNGLNMTWIESFPIMGTTSEYLFFVELEGHQNDAKLKKALTALRSQTVRLEILGSYAKSEPRG